MIERTPSQLGRDRQVFHEALVPVFDYVRDENIAEDAIGEYLSYDDVWEHYPEGWSDVGLPMVLLLSAASTPDQCRSLAERVRSEAGEQAAELVAGWADAPWRFCALEYVDTVRGSLLTFRVVGELPADWNQSVYSNQITVYSQALARHQKRGERRWLVMIAPMFGVFHTFGHIIPADAFNETDLASFARFFESEAAYEKTNVVPPLAGSQPLTEPLADVITRRLVLFLQLPDYRSMPPEFETLEGRDMCAAVALLHGSRERTDAGFWQEQLRERFPEMSFSVHGATFAVVLVDEDQEMEARVLVSSSDKRAFIQTMDIASYRFFRESLQPLVGFPEEPQQRTSLLVWGTVEYLVAPVDELGMLSETVSEQEPEEIGAFGFSPQEISRLNGAAPPNLEGVFRLLAPEEIQESAVDALLQTPMMSLARFLAEHYLETGVPLTASDYVKPVVVHAALEAGVVDVEPWHRDYYRGHRPAKELDCREFLMTRERLQACGFLKRSGAALEFTPLAKETEGDPRLLYHALLARAFRDYRWDILGSGSLPELPELRERGAFLLAVLRILSGTAYRWTECRQLLNAHFTVTGMAENENPWFVHEVDLWITLVDHLAGPFGLAEGRRRDIPPPSEIESVLEVRATPLFDQVFELRSAVTNTHRR